MPDRLCKQQVVNQYAYTGADTGADHGTYHNGGQEVVKAPEPGHVNQDFSTFTRDGRRRR